MGLRYRILGPLEIGDGGAPRRISSAKQRALLAVLLLHANEVVPADRLIDELWGESPPETAAKSLQIYVSRLRKAFRASGSGGRGLGSDALVTRPGGYMIRVEPDELDLERFEALLGEGDTALREGDSRRAARALTDALAIWRGPALADVELGSVEREQIGRLEELRMRSQEQLIDANLALGRHAEVVAELETLVGNHPLRERLRGQLMVALYRCGRQADALEVYRETRRKMVDELGIEPGAELRNLEQRILRQDPTLGAPAVSAPSRPESQRASRARSPRQPIALAAAALVALAIAATLIAILAAGGSGGETAEPNSVAVIDPADNKVVDGIPVGSEPSDVSADAGSLWVANAGDNTVSRIDQAARRVTATVAPGTAVNGMTAGEGAVWTSDVRRGVVSRIDPALRRVDRSISVSPGRYFDQLASPIIASTGSVWLGATFDEGRLSRIDASHGTIQARIPLDRGPDGMTAGEGAIWLTSGDTVERVDPTVNGVVAKIPVGRGASAIAAGDGGVWVADTLDNAVVHIDPGTNSVTSTIPVGTAPTGVAVGGGSVWVANSGDGTVSRVDPRTGRVSATVDVGESPRSLTFSDGSVWVSVGSAGASAEGAGSEGQVARVALGDQVDLPTDPALAVPSEVTYATSALLLDYPDSPSPAGSHLHPEVAEGMPAVSDGGRTYTYRIKEGFRFSPPSDQPVTADAFRRAIERVLSPSMQSFGGAVIQDIAGLQAYQDGRARHISGVTARGNTLTIRLTAPSPSLPARLATPYFSAVPPDTPIDPAGIPGIPSAGPYYIATADPNGGRVLKRNPNYGGNRPARTSVIDVLPAQSQARGIADVEEGKTDVVAISPEESGSARVRSQYGRPAAAAQGDSPRFLSGPFPGIEYLAFNTRRPLFSSVRMRRAVNYALDRPALASQALPGGPGRPTDQYIPPAVPGFADASIYPLDGPDLSQARRLARGAGGGKAVMYTCEDPWCSHNAAVVSSNLRAIGIELEVKTFPQEPISRLFRANEPWDIAEATWIADNADPFDSLNVPFGLLDKPNGINFGRFDDPAFERRLGTAATLSGPARYSTYGQLDADLAREQAPAAAYASNTRDYLFAAHVGCEVIQPIYGVDLGALCS